MSAEFEAFEKRVDADLLSRPILRLPIRAVVTSLHLVVDSLAHGDRRRRGNPPDMERASAAASRLSYLVPALSSCPADPIGVNAQDALEAYAEADPTAEQGQFLLLYGHFSELMPEYWKKYYTVEGDASTGFRLTHTSADFAEQEKRDFILTELSKAHGFNPPADLASEFDLLAKTAPRIDARQQMLLTRMYYQHYVQAIIEPPLITDAGFQEAAGVDMREFQRFRAALFAVSDFCLGMAAALSRRAQRSWLCGRRRATQEMYKWVSVFWKADFFLSLVGHFSGIERPTLERLLGFYTWDFSRGTEESQHAGDGFFPPLLQLGDAYLFNPNLVKLFLSWRNLIYGVKEAEKGRFNDFISHHLEPALVGAAVTVLNRIPTLQVVANAKWEKGEFDILAFSEVENTALHIQAKAAIPPQGARLVQSLEGRIREGLEQLARFRKLPPAQQDRVLSDKLGREVHNVHVVDVFLSSSSFGTARVWSKLGDVVPLNLALLELILRRLQDQGEVLKLHQLPMLVQEELERLIQEVQPRWSTGSITLLGTTITFPLLEHDDQALRREQVSVALTRQEAMWTTERTDESR